MAICKNCGSEIDDTAIICPKCGVSQISSSAKQAEIQDPEQGKHYIGYMILSVIFPIVGIILFFVWKNKFPKKAKVCLTAAIIAILVGIVMNIVGHFTGLHFFDAWMH